MAFGRPWVRSNRGPYARARARVHSCDAATIKSCCFSWRVEPTGEAMRRLGALSRGGVTSVPGFRSWEYLRASLLWRRSPRSWTPTQPSTSQLYLYLCFFFFVFLFFFFSLRSRRETNALGSFEIDSRISRDPMMIQGVCCPRERGGSAMFGRRFDVFVKKFFF